MKLYLLLIILLFTLTKNLAIAKVCKPKIIKSKIELKEKLKICDPGDNLLLLFDVKLNSDDLVINLCDLKYTVLVKDEINLIHKRGSGFSLICIYKPNLEDLN